MPTLLVRTSGSAPTIVAKMGAAIHGILIDYDYGADEKQEFGPAIQIEGGGVSIVNTFIHNPTTGIASNPSTNNGRVNLENIFIVNPRKVGVQFEFGLDIITIRNVEVWNYLPEMLRTSTGFRIGHADEIRISNCAVVGAAIGFHFIETKLPDGRLGRVWGGMSNSTVDFSGIGVKIDTANVLRITGGSIWAHHYGIVVDGDGDVIVGQTEIRANSHNNILVKGGKSLTVSGCTFKKGGGWEREPKIVVAGGGMVAISGSTFDALSPGIRLSPGTKRVAITGNVFDKSPHPSIANEAPQARVVIGNNLTGDL
jgi:hypothetical protein